MILSHYAQLGGPLTPYSVLQPAPGEHHERVGYLKPRGLWLSVEGEDSWAEWCRENDYGIGKYRHIVTLHPNNRIRIIKDRWQLEQFDREFRVQDPMFKTAPHLDRMAIDWRLVAAQHQGLIIAPYIWQHRFTMQWYYGWDCASGVIWDATAIADCRLIESKAA